MWLGLVREPSTMHVMMRVRSDACPVAVASGEEESEKRCSSEILASSVVQLEGRAEPCRLVYFSGFGVDSRMHKMGHK